MTHDLLNRLQLIANNFTLFELLLRVSKSELLFWLLRLFEWRFIKATVALYTIKQFCFKGRAVTSHYSSLAVPMTALTALIP